MGDCASKPKDLDRPDEAALPIEQPAKAAETAAAPAAAAEDKKDTSSGSNDQSPEEAAPLVDLSKPKEGEEDTKTADEAVLVFPGDAKIMVENPKGETVEVEVTAKEGEIIYVEVVKETKTEEAKEEEEKEEAVKEEEKVEQTTETAAPAAATSEDEKE